MLRPGLRKEIQDCLNKPPILFSDDFDVSIKKEYSTIELEIKFAVGNGEYFKATIPEQKNQNGHFEISTTYDPGEISNYERIYVNGFSSLTKAISNWAERIAEDIELQPIARLIAEQEARLSDLQQKLEEIPDDVATSEQVERVKEYLNQVEKELRGRIESLEADVEARKQKLEEIHAEFESLRKRSETTAIRKIVRAASARFFAIVSDPKFGTLIENGKKIIGLLPDITDKK